jgi:hypothetical protein
VVDNQTLPRAARVAMIDVPWIQQFSDEERMISSPHFFRDAGNRLTHDRADIESICYPDACRRVADHFGLTPSSELIVGPDQMFWDFTDGTSTVELAWDNWMCFMATAKTPTAERLVLDIAAFLFEASPPKSEQ